MKGDFLMGYMAKESRYDTMQYNRCGASGLKLPVVSLGFWHNFGDTGHYDNMKAMCRTPLLITVSRILILRTITVPLTAAQSATWDKSCGTTFLPYRDELLISTKAGYDMWPGPYGDWGKHAEYLIASLDASLKRLGLDYVDIFYHHRMDPCDAARRDDGRSRFHCRKRKGALCRYLADYDGPTLERCMCDT